MIGQAVPTLLCINRTYAQHAGVCLASLLENNRALSFEVVVATTDPLSDQEEKLQRIAAGYRNCTLRTVLFEPPIASLPTTSFYTLDTYTRLWVSDFFPAATDRVLYLDSDMIVVGPVSELWHTDIGDAIVGAVTIPGSDRCARYGIPEQFGYFNAGVLIINLREWRAANVLARLLDWIVANQRVIRNADQDALNGCLFDRRYPLPYIWNVITPFYFNSHPLGIPEAELRSIRQNARIIHFNGASKPWHYLNRHPRRSDYWKYLRQTEWRDYVAPDRNLINFGKKTFGPFVPRRIKGIIKSLG